ncbi:MAG: DUF3649 domain-containing protein [Paenalcaligenes sp.]
MQALHYLPLMSRCIAAIVGGYVVAALFSIAMLRLPQEPAEAVMFGMLYSFLVYAAVVIWVFAVRSAKRAWLGVIVPVAVFWPMANWPGLRAML